MNNNDFQSNIYIYFNQFLIQCHKPVSHRHVLRGLGMLLPTFLADIVQ